MRLGPYVMIPVFLLGSFQALALGPTCQNPRPEALRETPIKTYTLTLFKDVELKPNKNNRNYSLIIPNARFGSCVLFSKDPVLPAGEYTSAGAHAVKTRCEDVQDSDHGKVAYAFTKFNSLAGRDTLRIQCSSPATNEPFAPTADEAHRVLVDRKSGLRARVFTPDAP